MHCLFVSLSLFTNGTVYYTLHHWLHISFIISRKYLETFFVLAVILNHEVLWWYFPTCKYFTVVRFWPVVIPVVCNVGLCNLLHFFLMCVFNYSICYRCVLIKLYWSPLISIYFFGSPPSMWLYKYNLMLESVWQIGLNIHLLPFLTV